MEFLQAAEIKVSYQPNNQNKPVMKCSNDAYLVFKGFFSGDTISLQEQFAVMYLNRGNRVVGVYKLAKGSMTRVVRDIRLVLAVALKTAATGIMLCHNHPSESITPSVEDTTLTTQIKEAAKLMNITLLDHLIITRDKYYSFADDGLL
jgi:DNA repair protein RadC